jgi:ABC-type nickel/cobalt efflux system permease component RcnA
MTQELGILTLTAVSIGFFHTLLGPDHYLPFIVMGRAGKWSPGKTALVTVLCGTGHVLGSVAIGLIGVFLGIAVFKLEGIEAFRGDIAAWAMIAFGLAYGAWGLRRAIRNRPHRHRHAHDAAESHDHEHTHRDEHSHIHPSEKKANLTPWILFTIFVLGPCEPLIPLLMYPAANNSIFGLAVVTAAFGLVTILTMTGVVMAATLGINVIPLNLKKLERFTHALAGGAVLLCGLAIVFPGL